MTLLKEVVKIESKDILRKIKAVSYTHLDVYKRQVASCEDADKNTRNDADQSQLDSADAYMEKKNDIGTYHLASNYEEVYKLVDTDNIYVSYCGKDKELSLIHI